MRARITEKRVQVYTQPDSMSEVLAELKEGNELEIGGVRKVNGEPWVMVQLDGGKPGFVVGTTKVFMIKQGTLQQQVTAYSQPTTGSPVSAEFAKGTRLSLLGSTTEESMSWVRVRDTAGTEGYIDSKTKFQADKPNASGGREAGKKNMMYGALWGIGGLIVTVVTMQMATGSGGTYIVFWGAIIFGAIQFIRGLVQYLGAKS